ncbi:MAG: putative baseplate assembly protein [Cyanobium sp.]|nr:MAG: putative baseplate assembly protein [Cyanobium sp.]
MHPTLNGIDSLEVIDSALPNLDPLRQRTLLLTFLKPIDPAIFTDEQVAIGGGERVRDPAVSWVARATPLPVELAAPAEAGVKAVVEKLADPDRVLVVRTARAGDYSPYRLRLRRSAKDETPPEPFDVRLAEIVFSFKVDCPGDLDCRPAIECPPVAEETQAIDYLARDYPSLRRLMLDRISQLVPDWHERSSADQGVALVELLAYVCDQLAYQQDGIATEAYLETARLRTSLRRHALLVDYRLHEGCNARVWLHIRAAVDNVLLTQTGTRFYTRLPGVAARLAAGSREDIEALRAGPTVFEPMHEVLIHSAHNEIDLYDWGDALCCLPKGATRATLRDVPGKRLMLRVGDVLLLEEQVGPHTGRLGDADPTHRHVVRLTSVRPAAEQQLFEAREVGRLPGPLLLDQLPDATGEQVAIVEVAWALEDALPFPLCISSVADDAHGKIPVPRVSVARGNLVLADHGHSLPEVEVLGAVPPSRLAYPPDRDTSRCTAGAPTLLPPRFAPGLANGPLTFAGMVPKSTERLPFDPEAPAAAAMAWPMEDALPALAVHSAFRTGEVARYQDWEVRHDLLSSHPDDAHFVVEMEHDGSARLRFGDGLHSLRPAPGTTFYAHYRIGNGRTGNVGAGAIAHLSSSNADALSVRNPLPAQGGVDPEDAASLRRRAPQAFRRQERAVTPADWSRLGERNPGVQRAAATLRWTGSWHTVHLMVDRTGGQLLDGAFREGFTRSLERYRMAGQDLVVRDPLFVSLEIELLVCVADGYLRAAVHAGLLAVLGSGVMRDGRRGLFHPDNLTFGQTVYLSPLYAACREIAGVASVLVTSFQRQGNPDPVPRIQGFLPISPLEIPRLDSDPNYPEHGQLRLTLSGGQ